MHRPMAWRAAAAAGAAHHTSRAPQLAPSHPPPPAPSPPHTHTAVHHAEAVCGCQRPAPGLLGRHRHRPRPLLLPRAALRPAGRAGQGVVRVAAGCSQCSGLQARAGMLPPGRPAAAAARPGWAAARHAPNCPAPPPPAAVPQPGQASGMFWNYLSVGLDAEVGERVPAWQAAVPPNDARGVLCCAALCSPKRACLAPPRPTLPSPPLPPHSLPPLPAKAAYGFHTMREAHGWAASNRLFNQAWYSWYSCSSGWFCGAQVRAPGRCVAQRGRWRRHRPPRMPCGCCAAPTRPPAAPQPCTPAYMQPLTNKMSLRVRDEEGGEWREVVVPRSVRALVLLNIQASGRAGMWLLGGLGSAGAALPPCAGAPLPPIAHPRSLTCRAMAAGETLWGWATARCCGATSSSRSPFSMTGS